MAEKLTDKQRIFCMEYMRDLNATKAAERAGYSANSAGDYGAQLMANDLIKARIQVLFDQRATRLEITAESILASILDTRERCKQSRPVVNRKGEQVFVENAEGELVPAYEFDASGANRADELLGKHIKLFNEGTGLNLNVTQMGKVEIEETTGSGETKKTTLTFDVGAQPDHQT